MRSVYFVGAVLHLRDCGLRRLVRAGFVWFRRLFRRVVGCLGIAILMLGR